MLDPIRAQDDLGVPRGRLTHGHRAGLGKRRRRHGRPGRVLDDDGRRAVDVGMHVQVALAHVTLDQELVLLHVAAGDNDKILGRDEPEELFEPERLAQARDGRRDLDVLHLVHDLALRVLHRLLGRGDRALLLGRVGPLEVVVGARVGERRQVQVDVDHVLARRLRLGAFAVGLVRVVVVGLGRLAERERDLVGFELEPVDDERDRVALGLLLLDELLHLLPRRALREHAAHDHDRLIDPLQIRLDQLRLLDVGKLRLAQLLDTLLVLVTHERDLLDRLRLLLRGLELDLLRLHAREKLVHGLVERLLRQALLGGKLRRHKRPKLFEYQRCCCVCRRALDDNSSRGSWPGCFVRKDVARLDGRCRGRDERVHRDERSDQSGERLAIERQARGLVPGLEPRGQDGVLGHDGAVLERRERLFERVTRVGPLQQVAQPRMGDRRRRLGGLGNVVGLAHGEARLLVGLDDAQERHDAVLVVGEDDVASRVKLDKEIEPALGTGKVKLNDAVVAELAHVHQAARADVLAQLHRKARRDVVLVAEELGRVHARA
eukprot:Unigene330_Nuclearia_a/m.1125 Unigene330_Nuclearia_a/g.1125  ORF Unigene330_Nuclearia_a/g.1125 Unigene330_Nuclearia_a/m.1125 type:complete len:548 (+) Unigene330_Nuclearia_a:1385-3028(+)